MKRGLFGLLFLAGCGTRPTSSELPQLRLEDYQAAVRAELSKAWEAAKAAPHDAEKTGRLGMLLHAHEQWGAAAACYRAALKLDSKRFDWSYYLADVYSQVGRREEALAALNAALKQRPDYEPARIRLAELLLDAGKAEESAELYQRLLKENDRRAAAWYGLGRIQSARGDTKVAIASLEKATALYSTYGPAHYALALALRKQGRAGEAESHMRSYERHKLDVPPMQDVLLAEVRALNVGATNFIRQGAELEAQGKLDEAIQAHLRALESDPSSEQAHVNLIQLYARTGNAAEAERQYETVITRNPNHAEAYYNYGVVQFSAQKFAGAQQAFEKCLKANPQHAGAHNNLGYLLERKGLTAAAIAHYRKALEFEPNHRLAHFHLGRNLTLQGQFKEAIAHLEKTIDPDDEQAPTSLYALGAALARSGDIAGARRRLQAAREKAQARGQTALLASIDRDLGALGKAR
jgi:tetratricopeptide (TPR) repeat protein